MSVDDCQNCVDRHTFGSMTPQNLTGDLDSIKLVFPYQFWAGGIWSHCIGKMIGVDPLPSDIVEQDCGKNRGFIYPWKFFQKGTRKTV